MRLVLAAAVLLCVASGEVFSQTGPPSLPVPPESPVAPLLRRLEAALTSGDVNRYFELLSPTVADRTAATEFLVQNVIAGAGSAVVRESDRSPLRAVQSGLGYRLLVEVFMEKGSSGQVGTWRLDVRKEDDSGQPSADGEWRIVDQERLTLVEGLYRLAVNPEKQYDVENLVVNAEDLVLTLPRGSAFVAETDFGMTALILTGRGHMRFAPAPAPERVQVRIFSGNEVLDADFDAAFIRLNPDDAEARVSLGAMTPRAVNARALRRARELFDEHAPESFGLDLAGLSPDKWWVLPNLGDFLAEIRTRRFDTLTYVRGTREAEDIRLFHRKKKRNISVYPSREKLAVRGGPFYSEDDLVEYDVLDYNVQTSFFPEREWISGRTAMRIRTLRNLVTMTIRLADTLTVHSAVADSFGRLLPLRAPGQDSVIVNFPTTVPMGFELTITMTYAGRMPAQAADHEAIQESPFVSAIPGLPPERHYLYSNRAYWYPQSTVTDYATATLHLTVPPGFDCVSSGEPSADPPMLLTGIEGIQDASKRYLFIASQPVRYLATLVTRFEGIRSSLVPLSSVIRPGPEGEEHPARSGIGVFYDSLAVSVTTNPRQQARGRQLSEKATDIARFYASLVGDVPYPAFTLALVENDIPGGHSPGYFAMLKQPLPTAPFSWGGDPVHFDEFPDFFLAHELAHQWWGQAVGWNNYHEQWLSEGFAQYFAALYAQRSRGDRVFASILRQMQRSAMDHSDQGPIYLGYRLGHIKGQSRVFRALVYNKGALVLHMLRRLIGDDAFFRGLRRYYGEWRFQKAGTEDLRRALEAESDKPLQRFFERWIYNSDLPSISYTMQTAAGGEGEGAAADPSKDDTSAADVLLLRFRQTGETFDVPLTVTLNYASGISSNVLVRVTDRTAEVRIPLVGVLNKVDLNRDYAALAALSRN